ncbi:DUF6973 domain-containing protein [Streptosporangium sandarakinum]
MYNREKSDADLAKTWALLKKINGEDGNVKSSGGAPAGSCSACWAKKSKKSVPPPPDNENDNDWLQWLRTAGVCVAYGLAVCARVAEISAYSMWVVTNVNDSNAKNAMRHFVWMAAIAAVDGAKVARSVADAHEAGTGRKTWIDSQRDRRNNYYGINYGIAHQGDLQWEYWSAPIGAGARDLTQDLGKVAFRKYRAGQLAIVKGGKVVG